jgi:hypothetical protein
MVQLFRFPLFHPWLSPPASPEGNEGGKGYGEAEGIKKVCSIGVLPERLINKIYALITNSLSWGLQ